MRFEHRRLYEKLCQFAWSLLLQNKPKIGHYNCILFVQVNGKKQPLQLFTSFELKQSIHYVTLICCILCYLLKNETTSYASFCSTSSDFNWP